MPGPLARMFVPLHRALVQRPRRARLVPVLSSLAGPAESLLDVGAGDGALGRDVAQRLSARWLGVDVARQPGAPEVALFDGRTLPFADGTFDAVLLCDVLHHAREPAALLGEALRVSRRAVVLKDHFRFGPASQAWLTWMDLAGNRPYGVDVLGRYFTPGEWLSLLDAAGARVAALRWPLQVHLAPLAAVTRSELQFAARLERGAAA